MTILQIIVFVCIMLLVVGAVAYTLWGERRFREIGHCCKNCGGILSYAYLIVDDRKDLLICDVCETLYRQMNGDIFEVFGIPPVIKGGDSLCSSDIKDVKVYRKGKKKMKSCWICEHLEFIMGDEGYSEETPEFAPEVSCGPANRGTNIHKNMFFDFYADDCKARAIEIAENCEHFTVEKEVTE